MKIRKPKYQINTIKDIQYSFSDSIESYKLFVSCEFYRCLIFIVNRNRYDDGIKKVEPIKQVNLSQTTKLIDLNEMQ